MRIRVLYSAVADLHAGRLYSAVADLHAGRLFYEEQAEGVGAYFFDSLFSDIDSLALYAGIHPKVYGYRSTIEMKKIRTIALAWAAAVLMDAVESGGPRAFPTTNYELQDCAATEDAIPCSGDEGTNAMTMTLNLDTMTIADKLQAIEVIWDDLLRSAEQVPSPAWHGDVLRAREARVREGKSHYTDWADAKRRIRERTQ